MGSTVGGTNLVQHETVLGGTASAMRPLKYWVQSGDIPEDVNQDVWCVCVWCVCGVCVVCVWCDVDQGVWCLCGVCVVCVCVCVLCVWRDVNQGVCGLCVGGFDDEVLR